MSNNSKDLDNENNNENENEKVNTDSINKKSSNKKNKNRYEKYISDVGLLIIFQDLIKRQERINQQKEVEKKRIEDELEKCTFKPKTCEYNPLLFENKIKEKEKNCHYYRKEVESKKTFYYKKIKIHCVRHYLVEE